MPTGPDRPIFAGEVVAFTGRLSSLSRRQAHCIVRSLGGVPAEEGSPRATIVVAGAAGRGGTPSIPGAAVSSIDGAATEAGEGREGQGRTGASGTTGTRRPRVMGEDEFCALAGLPQPSELSRKYYAASEIVQRYPHVGEAHLKYLEKWGLVRPAARTRVESYFQFSDVALIKRVSDDLARGVGLRAIIRSLQAERSGQLALDFGPTASAGKVLRFDGRAPAGHETAAAGRAITSAGRTVTSAAGAKSPGPDEAERLFLEASQIDEGGQGSWDAAARAYRQVLALDPSFVPALINLGNLYYEADMLAEAQALYERAAAVDEYVFEAPFNLGNIHHDQGRFEEARACYETAVRLDPKYADAHFYLAVTLEKLGRSNEAKPHWRAYQRLAPDGEWIELAKEFSE